jgi:cytosine/creatinine deaminase
MNRFQTPFFEQLDRLTGALGGMHNAHLHLDRAGTLTEHYTQLLGFDILDNSHISLHKKHSLITRLHQGPAFDPKDLHDRADSYLNAMIEANTVRADTMVDVTDDGVGLKALETLRTLKAERAADIDLRLGAYSPFGFTDSEPRRWDLMVEGARQADFIGCLPEADDTIDYPDHIGFDEHCKRFLLLAQSLGKMLHVHVDQRNEPSESGTEQLIEAVREFGSPTSATGEPMVWAIHMISPSTYDERRFLTMVEGLLELNIGLVSCPSAALGMRQFRALTTPTYNSIPRILELLAEGIHVRLGSDNIADICSPSTTADLRDEILVLSAAVRFYHPQILAKLAAGRAMDATDRRLIRAHLERNDQEIQEMLERIDSTAVSRR